jgi:hypothetical protein
MSSSLRRLAPGVLLALAGCRPAAQGAPPRSTASAPETPTARPTPPAAPDALDWVRARGGLHRVIHAIGFAGESFRLSAQLSVVPQRDPNPVTLAFTGDTEVAAGAWVIADRSRPAEVRAVERWPSGVHVIAAGVGVFAPDRVDRRVIYVLVETTAALDRPAGQRSVLMLSDLDDRAHAWRAESAPLDVQRRVSERIVSDGPSLVRAANHLEGGEPLMDDWPHPTLFPDGQSFVWRARTPHALAAELGLARVKLFTRYPDGIVVPTATVQRSAFDTSPIVTSLLGSIIRGRAIWQLNVEPITSGPDGYTLSAEIAPAAPTRPPATTATQTVADDGDRALVERELRARYAGDPRVVAAARLSAQGGTVAVAEVAAAHASVVVVVERGVTRVFDLGRALAFSRDRDPDGAAVRAVRFLDGNGDGRADVLVESEEAGVVAHRGLYLTPSASMASELTYDLGSAVVLNTAATLDDAVAALATVPWRSVIPRAACPLAQAARTLAGLRRVGARDLRVITFGEYNAYAWRATFRPPSELSAEALSELADRAPPYVSTVRCPDIRCASDRPVCWHHPNAYWFSWDGPRLRLAAVAMYGGR